MSSSDLPSTPKPKTHPFRRAVFRGLAVALPPLLTVVIFLWVGSTINAYVLQPVKGLVQQGLAWSLKDVRQFDGVPPHELIVERDGTHFHRLPKLPDGKVNRDWVPLSVYEEVTASVDVDRPLPTTGTGMYLRYVEVKYLQPQFIIPIFTCVFILVMYLIGKFLAVGIGHFFVHTFERGINRLPLIRNVYGSVKQVTDFVFSEQHVEYTRVVALEYPRMGIWSLGLVTGESMLDIRSAANEPVLSVLIPTSPAPVTGYTVTIRKSEAIDLNITIDQAFQFIVSCGVVVAPQQLQDALKESKSNGSEAADESAESAAALPASGS